MLSRKLWYLAECMRFQWKDPKTIKRIQFLKLREIIGYAGRKVPYYRKLFHKHRIIPESIRSPADLSRIPLLTKNDIRSNFQNLLSSDFKASGCVSRFTSGSSGVPLTVLYDQNAWDYAEAVYARALFNIGVKPWSRCAFFWAEPFPKDKWHERLGLMQKNYIATTKSIEHQIDRLNDLQPSVIYIFPSSLRLLVTHFLNGNLRIKPEIIVCTGELLPHETKKEFQRIFRCRVFDQYGTQELNRMAWTCEYYNGFHIDEEAVYIEFLKNGIPVSDGEQGKMVVTGLFNRAMPLIRYDLGDIAAPVSSKCRCGRGLGMMRIYEGRADSIITLPSGKKIGPRAITGIFDHLMLHSNKLLTYRLIQKANADLELNLVKGDRFDDDTVELILSSLNKLFNENVNIETKIVDDISRSKGGKFRYVYSEIMPQG